LGYLLPAIIGLESMGVPSPGETALVLAAILASQGKLQIWLVIVVADARTTRNTALGRSQRAAGRHDQRRGPELRT
jgi:hypothetical protein